MYEFWRTRRDADTEMWTIWRTGEEKTEVGIAYMLLDSDPLHCSISLIQELSERELEQLPIYVNRMLKDVESDGCSFTIERPMICLSFSTLN